MSEESQKLRATFCTQAENPRIVEQLFRFRKALFVDTLKWDLAVESGCERDQFDTDATVHCALFRDDEIIAGFRAIRSDQPYLARCVFPQLATIMPYPQRRDVWEISRFGVLPSEAGSVTGQILYSLVFYFARLHQMTSLVALADLRYERFLTQIGIRTRRYGPPQVIGTDEKGDPLTVVVGETPMANQRGRRFEALLKLIDNVEIQDETHVLGSDRLSA